MAELYIIGELINATEFTEPNLFIKWSIQYGTSWKIIEGLSEGETSIDNNRLENQSTFSHPIDIHLACRGLHGWPKLHIEIYAVNALNNYWPVGFGFAHIPSLPGFHKIEILAWKIAPEGVTDFIREKFHGGGLTINKSDFVYSGTERYKLYTKSSGIVNVELMLIFKNFEKFGVELY